MPTIGARRSTCDSRRSSASVRGALNAGIDLGNLLNTNYATTYEDTYQYSAGNTAQGGTWNNPTAIYTPRFIRWNVTVDY